MTLKENMNRKLTVAELIDYLSNLKDKDGDVEALVWGLGGVIELFVTQEDNVICTGIFLPYRKPYSSVAQQTSAKNLEPSKTESWGKTIEDFNNVHKTILKIS